MGVAKTSLYMINSKELSTSEIPAVLEGTSKSTYKDVVSLLTYPSGIAMPSLAVQQWFLVRRTRNF